ncbi:hypothetical protein [Mesorhizobium dulcispinae]|uniref:hypothetical protein n=1 Tax=Mesorhizobium dulcispinae TaxID=3072316 RepID=UPI002A248D7B|nr:hypothetical protein [Mesorhizobium sp. VK23D]MDX8519805.1 hypothetical protein [Mesorhizobium sp. VK23D]
MGDMLIRNIPEASPEPHLSAWDAIRSAYAAENAIDDEFANTMREIETERKRDFGCISIRRN